MNNNEEIIKLKDQLAQIEAIGKIGRWEFLVPSQEIVWSQQMFIIFDRESGLDHPSLSEIHDAIHYTDQLQWELMINKVSIDGIPSEATFKILTKNLDVKWVRMMVKGIYEGTRVVALQGFCQDVTELKELQTHHELTKRLIE